jgi:hypothetical protein
MLETSFLFLILLPVLCSCQLFFIESDTMRRKSLWAIWFSLVVFFAIYFLLNAISRPPKGGSLFDGELGALLNLFVSGYWIYLLIGYFVFVFALTHLANRHARQKSGRLR